MWQSGAKKINKEGPKFSEIWEKLRMQQNHNLNTKTKGWKSFSKSRSGGFCLHSYPKVKLKYGLP